MRPHWFCTVRSACSPTQYASRSRARRPRGGGGVPGIGRRLLGAISGDADRSDPQPAPIPREDLTHGLSVDYPLPGRDAVSTECAPNPNVRRAGCHRLAGGRPWKVHWRPDPLADPPPESGSRPYSPRQAPGAPSRPCLATPASTCSSPSPLTCPLVSRARMRLRTSSSAQCSPATSSASGGCAACDGLTAYGGIWPPRVAVASEWRMHPSMTHAHGRWCPI